MFFELLADYGLFFAKTATFLVALLIVIAVIVNASSSQGQQDPSKLKIKKINDRFKNMERELKQSVLEPQSLKVLDEQEKKSEKEKDKTAKKAAKEEKKKLKANSSEEEKNERKKRVYVLDFDGDIKASPVDKMRDEITAVLTLATVQDEILIKLESGGGMVHAYGLAASQLARIKSAGIPLTICVDKVAASGGYMMACLADKILAAPFAIIGSIGVVASLPNFHKVLKKYDIDYELLTAGEYKRTLTMLGENTEEGRAKFKQDLEDTHVMFQEFVSEYRPQLDIQAVATGEVWYGKKALDKQLVDEISTSDAYICDLAKEADVFEVRYESKKNWQEKLGFSVENAFERSIDKVLARLSKDWETRH